MEKCVFIGYPEGYKGWKFYNPVTKKVIISERADFDERYTYWGKVIKGGLENTDPEPRPMIPMPIDIPPVVPPEPIIADENVNEDNENEEDSGSEEEQSVAEPQPVPIVDDNDQDNRPIALCRSKCNIRPPGEWWKIRHPSQIIPSDSDDSDEEGVHVIVSGEIEPQSFREAMNLPLADKWRDACLEEYNWHLTNGTWDLVELPPGMKAIGSKWVFQIKHNADGSIEWFKAHLVAKGFAQ
jgi:hypothetical protein